MKTHLHLIVVVILLAFHSKASAQCRINVEAPDSLPFLLTLNDVAINQVPVLAITLNQNSSGKVNFKANFPARPELSFSQVITLKKGTFLNYTIERNKGTLKFVLTSESEIDLPEFSDVKNDDGIATVPDIQHKGCYPVVDDALYQAMLVNVGEELFESKKLTLLSNFASTQCIRTEQLRTMMSSLTQEDNKLSLLIASKNHIYDLEQISDVLNEFHLARNKQKATEILEANR